MHTSGSSRYVMACIIALLQACAASPARPPDTRVSASEVDAWELMFSDPVRAADRSLHEEPHAFADGAKGVWMPAPVYSRVVPLFPPGITREDEWRMWNARCSASLIVTATLRDTTPFLMFGKHGIATRSRFVVDDVVRAPAGIGHGSSIDTAQLGGELIDDGELLRVVASESGSPLIVGQQYLLIVFPHQSGEGHRFTGPPRARKVGEMLYFDGDSSGHDLLPRISEYTRLQRSMADLVARVPCPLD